MNNIVADLQPLAIDINSCILDPKNARTGHDLDGIVDSLIKYGQRKPIVINEKTGFIEAGNGTWAAAQKAGWDKIAAVRVKDDPATATGFAIVDNRLGDLSHFDFNILNDLLKDQPQDLPGISGDFQKEIEKELAQMAGSVGATDPDVIPEIQKDPISKIGDLWVCGRHKVFCGDSTNINNLNKLLEPDGGGKSDMVFTDPPYLMNFEGSLRGDGTKSANGKFGRIKNDKMSKNDGMEFLKKICMAIKKSCSGAYYICFYRLGIDWLLAAMEETGLKWRCQIIWKKNNITLSNSDYKSVYEPIITGWSDDYMPIFYGWNNIPHDWYGRKNERDVWEIELPSIWEISKVKKSDKHPTMKPVELVERAICNSSKQFGSVLDLFLGSGTTLIAAERQNRVCYGIELDPLYCDIAVKRWEEYTGKKAHLA